MTPGAKRLAISEAATLTKIPVLPISYGDAQPLLSAVSGPVAPVAVCLDTCHIHVAGVPTRLEIDDKQELNFRSIANTIADLGYTGFVAHEWRPGMGNDPVKSLERCFEIMNV